MGYARKQEEKMSEIFKEMAMIILKDPKAIPSSEAAHACLLFSHVAWNRAVGEEFSDSECRAVLKKFEKSRPTLWEELRTRDWKLMVDQLVAYKKEHYPEDNRIVAICGMRGPGIIHVEWRYQDGHQTQHTPPVLIGPKIGRNDPCHCGSGIKFKRCCGSSSTAH